MKKTIYALLSIGAVAFLAPTLMGAALLHIPEKEFDFGYCPQISPTSRPATLPSSRPAANTLISRFTK